MRYQVTESINLASERVRGTYPRTLRIFKKAHTPNWYAEFYADKETLGDSSLKRGKRMSSSMGTADQREAVKRAIAWAREKAEEIHAAAHGLRSARESSLLHYAEIFKERFERQIAQGARKRRALNEHLLRLSNGKGTGILQQEFSSKSVTQVSNAEILEYFEELEAVYGDKQRAAIKTTLRCLYEEAMREDYPELQFPRFPKIRQGVKTPTYFDEGQWQRLLIKCRQMAGTDSKGREYASRKLGRDEFLDIPHQTGRYVTQRNFLELYQLLLLMGHTFIRVQDLYRIRVRDFAVIADKETGAEALAIRLPDPKTKQTRETIASTPRAVDYWERIKARSSSANDYCFFNEYERPKGAPENGRMYDCFLACWHKLLEYADLKTDKFGRKHTPTSIRHTAFMLFLERNQGRVDLQTLAWNGHTSVQMLEKTYLTHINASKRIADLHHGSEDIEQRIRQRESRQG